MILPKLSLFNASLRSGPIIPGLPVVNNYLDEGPTAAEIVDRESVGLIGACV